ncbi:MULTISPECIES: DUF4287 domain-containing protein [Kitasatospora]|uniref:DUF4287 domain-containing protein n=1 Tax=Kitasatospora cathayae TaxID=3004092 RepID=A0ABY7QE73_9ACTN|nr:DUF4287 domain-containing protein [Kitasatospora sp. HUAS 3-15]WBP91021.1 DUF4287 domain-containing protein [Kitasatospora sp. HUAS 3-15]
MARSPRLQPGEGVTEEWKDLNLIRTCPLTKHSELVTWLKTTHGHGHANALVAHALAERA